MKHRLIMITAVTAMLAMPVTVLAQGIVRGAQEGAAEGNRAAGPVGGAVGGVVGGAVGGAVGGVKGVLGIPQGSGGRRTAALSPTQLTSQLATRTARLKTALQLTPEQEKIWPGFETAVNDVGKRAADRQAAMQAPADVVEQVRLEAKYVNERAADRVILADAAQPLFASLSDAQKQRFAKEFFSLSHWPDSN